MIHREPTPNTQVYVTYLSIISRHSNSLPYLSYNLNKSNLLHVNAFQYCWMSSSVYPDQTSFVASDLGLHCLHRPVCLYHTCPISKVNFTALMYLKTAGLVADSVGAV